MRKGVYDFVKTIGVLFAGVLLVLSAFVRVWADYPQTDQFSTRNTNSGRPAMYEIEPNNTMSTANTIANDSTKYGKISYQGDIDYYVVTFPYGGQANFWLGNIPKGKNYDLYLYSSVGTLLSSSTSTTARHEFINHYPVSQNTTYYVRIDSPDNSYDDSKHYQLSVKCYATKDARIYYDSSCTLSTNEMNSYYDTAISAFLSEFNIEFIRNYTSQLSLLDGSSCPNTTISQKCSTTCGSLADCAIYHHKGAGRLYAISSLYSYYTYRLVGHALCCYTDSEHISVVGLGSCPGKDAITSVLSSIDISRSIQHELTHNLGGSHSTCTSGQYCVLKGDI